MTCSCSLRPIFQRRHCSHSTNQDENKTSAPGHCSSPKDDRGKTSNTSPLSNSARIDQPTPSSRSDWSSNPKSSMSSAPKLNTLHRQTSTSIDTVDAINTPSLPQPPSPQSSQEREIHRLISDHTVRNNLSDNAKKELQEALEVGSKDDLDFILEFLTETHSRGKLTHRSQ